MKKLIHPKGYTVKVDSWENDADNPRTEEVTTTSLDYAKALKELALLFRDSPIANMYDRDTEELKKFHESHTTFFTLNNEEDPETDEDLLSWYSDILYEMGLKGGDFYTRVCEDVQIYHFEDDVYAEVI